MRVIGEIPHPACKITLFQWNGKYIIKIEHGPLEQSFKINEFDVANQQEIKKIITDDFMSMVMSNFRSMHQGLVKSVENII